MARRYTYAASLNWGGDIPTAELEVEVSYEVEWGTPPSGLFGPPEHYDPGSGSFVEAIKVEKIDGKSVEEATRYEYMRGETVRQIIDKLEMDHADAMVEEAYEQDAADADYAAEARWEAQRDEREF